MRLVALLAGVTWLARGLLRFADPIYYAPVTALDVAAVVLTSVAFALLAPSLRWLASAGSRAARTAATLAGLAALLAAIGNFIEDALRVPAFGVVYVIGALGLALALIAVAILLFRLGHRWPAAIAFLTLLGLFAADLGGGIVIGLGWIYAATRSRPRTT